MIDNQKHTKDIIKLLKMFLEIVPKKNKYFILPTIILVIADIIYLGLPIIGIKYINQIKMNPTLDTKYITILLVAWSITFVIFAIIEYWQTVSLKKYGSKVVRDLHAKIVFIIMKRKQTISSLVNSKELSQKISKELDDFFPLVSGNLINYIRNIIILVSSLLALFIINYKLALLICILFPFFLINFLIGRKKLENDYNELKKEKESYFSSLVELLQTKSLIYIFESFSYEIGRINSKYNNYLDIKNRYLIYIALREILSKVLKSFAPIYLLIIAYISINYHLATFGELFAFWFIFSLVLLALSNLISLYVSILQSINSFKFIEEYLSYNNNTANNNNKDTIYTIESITLLDVKHTYNERKVTIEVPSFTINKGDLLEIKGKSGIGKSTIIKIILGLIVPTRGEVLINGIQFNKIEVESYLNKIGYVEQNGYLYSRSLQENITLGRAFNYELFDIAIKKARLDEIVNLSEKVSYNSIGENGIQLSGGEKQRILIARAIYSKPEWFILDEPFNGLDLNNMDIIKEIIEDISKTATVILVSHNKMIQLKSNRSIIVNKII